MSQNGTTRYLLCPLRDYTAQCETPRACAAECKYERMNRELDDHMGTDKTTDPPMLAKASSSLKDGRVRLDWFDAEGSRQAMFLSRANALQLMDALREFLSHGR